MAKARKVVVRYKDIEGYGSDRIAQYSTNPYSLRRAKEIAGNLAILGCFDFEFEPYQETA